MNWVYLLIEPFSVKGRLGIIAQPTKPEGR